MRTPTLVSCAWLLAGCAALEVARPPGAGDMSGGQMVDETRGAVTKAATDDLIIVLMAETTHRQLRQGGTIARDDRLPPRYARYLAGLAQRHGMVRVADWPLSAIDARCLVFRTDRPEERDRIVRALNTEPGVALAQPLQYFDTLGDAPEYNDPYVPMQHSLRVLQVRESHQWATGAGVRVAVIDTGLDHKHPDLSGGVAERRNFVDRSATEFRTDVHGTAVAGVIAARANNATGMVGIAPDSQLLALKACWQRSPRRAVCSSFTLAKALNFAISERVDVINLSLGGPPDALLTRLVRRAVDLGIAVVGAVHPLSPDYFPAAVPDVIAVAPIEYPQTAKGFVRAPAEQVLTTAPNGEYDFQSGSSLSTAQVTGIVALLRQRKPHIAPRIVRDLLEATAIAGSVSGCRALAQQIPGASCPAEAGRQTGGE